MAFVIAAVTSLGTRVIEYSIDYDGKVKRYLESENSTQERVRWQVIMDNIALYPKRHSALLSIKFGSDAVLLYGAAQTIAPIIRSIASNIWQKIKTCFNKFMEFLNQMYNAAYDLYQSSTVSQLTGKLSKMLQRITQQIMESWRNFVNNLCDTLDLIKNRCKALWKWIRSWTSVDVTRNGKGQAVLTISGATGPCSYIPAQMIYNTFQGAYRIITNIWTWIVSSVGLLISWVAKQLKVEVFKYYCSFVGLINYYINQIPNHVGRIAIAAPQ